MRTNDTLQLPPYVDFSDPDDAAEYARRLRGAQVYARGTGAAYRNHAKRKTPFYRDQIKPLYFADGTPRPGVGS